MAGEKGIVASGCMFETFFEQNEAAPNPSDPAFFGWRFRGGRQSRSQNESRQRRSVGPAERRRFGRHGLKLRI